MSDPIQRLEDLINQHNRTHLERLARVRFIAETAPDDGRVGPDGKFIDPDEEALFQLWRDDR